MEFLKAMQNNPNALMTEQGAKGVMKLIQNSLDDQIDQQKDLQEWMRKKGMDPNDIGGLTPQQLSALASHQVGYTNMAVERNRARSVLDNLSGKGIEVSKGVTVQPYWSNKYRSMVAKMPDGTIRKVNVGSTEE